MVNLAAVAVLHLSAVLTCAAVQGSPAQRESVSLAFGNEPTGSANAAVVSVIESATTPAKRLVIGFFMMSLLPLLLPLFQALNQGAAAGARQSRPYKFAFVEQRLAGGNFLRAAAFGSRSVARLNHGDARQAVLQRRSERFLVAQITADIGRHFALVVMDVRRPA